MAPEVRGIAMTRDDMIRLLVLERLENRDKMNGYLHLHDMLENGFRGFRNLSDKELLSELRARGLEQQSELPVDDFDDFSDDRIFDSSLAAGHGIFAGASGEFSQ
jgi:hypothetical protein